MIKSILCTALVLFLGHQVGRAQVVLNPDGSHSVVTGNVIVNQDGTHSVVAGNVVVNSNGTHSVIVGNVLVNANGSHSILLGVEQSADAKTRNFALTSEKREPGDFRKRRSQVFRKAAHKKMQLDILKFSTALSFPFP